MEMDGCQKIDLGLVANGCAENDRFSDLNIYDLDEAVGAQKEDDMSLGMNTDDHLPELCELRVAERAQKNGRYNLRKSLAWDAAFFTSAGVLDPEELSCMITGTDKSEKHSLPGIQEDIRESTESISTLESDNLNLETLEDDLFVDIRASIQRSSKKTSDLTNSSNKKPAIEVDSASISSLKKEDFASQNKNLKQGSRKISGLQMVKMSKSLPNRNIVKQGTGKAVRQDSGCSQITSTAKIGEKNPIITNTPKTINKHMSTLATAKRESMGIGRGKSECDSSKFGAPGTQPPNVSGGARRPLPRPAVSSKSSLLGSSTSGRVQSTSSSTLGDNSGSMSSGNPAKSTLMMARRKPSRNGNVLTGASGSLSRTPSRAVLKNKPPPSTLSAHLTSTKISSSVSPASSMSEWLSASSSSPSPLSSTVNSGFNNSRTSLDTNSCMSKDGDVFPLPPRNPSADQTDGYENHGDSLPPSNNSKKPSGLRMPSPKIGFFDGVKSSAHTPNGHQQSQLGLQTVFPKNGIRRSNSKLKSTKAPAAGMVNYLASGKLDSPKSTSSQEKLNASINVPSVPLDVEDSPGLSLGKKGNAPGERCQKAEKVQSEDGVEQVVDAGTGAIIEGNLMDLNNETDLDMHNNMATGDIKTLVEGSNISGLEVTGGTGDELANQNHLKHNLHSNCQATEKENTRNKHQVVGLTVHNRTAYQNGCGPKYQLQNDTSESTLPFISTASECAANRSPLALKNHFCTNVSIDASEELASHVANKIVSA